jgi:AcrR family transcriptional regulator
VIGTRLEDIRRDAGASVGALYHHFADKAELADALFLDCSAQFQTAFVATLRENPEAGDGIRAGVRCYLRWVTRHRTATQFMLAHRPGAERLRPLNRAFFAEVLDWWRPHARYGAVREIPVELLHPLWLGPGQEYTRAWLSGHGRGAPAAHTEALAGAAWEALRREPPADPAPR